VNIAIQGIEGSFHAEAAKKLISTQSSIVPCDSFEGVFRAVNDGSAQYGVVAIENSLHGSINTVYRLLERYELWVSGETTLAIKQYLIAHEQISLKQLVDKKTHILSQAPALAQVEQWIDNHLPLAVREETHDTAASVQMIVRKKSQRYLAVAGKHAAKLYGGHIVAGPINDDVHNYTRFVLLEKHLVASTKANRTMIILKTDHTPGALLQALSFFAENGINLSKLDSHPIAGDTRHYAFYIDFEEGVSSRKSQKVIQRLTDSGYSVKILGSYHV
jgi:prephenate dehydratase